MAISYGADLNQNLNWNRAILVAQATTSRSAKTPPQATPVAPSATGAEIVGKMLSVQPSDPDVPLPRSDLTTQSPGNGSSEQPMIYGRQEVGGGVVGLKIPIPADRSAAERRTRSSPGTAGAD